jgi:hypothetical protein
MIVPGEPVDPHWRLMTSVTIRQAACLLVGIEPQKFLYSMFDQLPERARTMSMSIAQAIFAKKLRAHVVMVKLDGGEYGLGSIDDAKQYFDVGDSSQIRVHELAEWCNENAIGHPWNQSAIDPYPQELRAAIEAFNAVRGDSSVTKRCSPKAALAAWLEKNKPDLSASARERVATVANWQPAGGAPKTPSA